MAALHFAAWEDKQDCAQLLLETAKSCKFEKELLGIKDNDGRTALGQATYFKKQEVAKVLEAAHRDCGLPDTKEFNGDYDDSDSDSEHKDDLLHDNDENVVYMFPKAWKERTQQDITAPPAASHRNTRNNSESIRGRNEKQQEPQQARWYDSWWPTILSRRK